MSVGSVILSVFLMFTIIGVYNGMNSYMDSIVMKTGADIWITQEGTSGSAHSPSILPIQVGDKLATIPEIEVFTPLIRTAIIFPLNGVNILLFVNGYNTTEN